MFDYRLMTHADFGALPGALRGRLLGAAEFSPGAGEGLRAGLPASVPEARIAMPVLAGDARFEGWFGVRPVEYFDDDGMHAASDGEHFFAVLREDEAAGAGLEAFTQGAYLRMAEASARRGCPHVLRVFHYIPRITEDENGLERYRHFNIGRQAAFAALDRPLTGAPAACALGTQGRSMVLYFLASRHAGAPLENPRQVSAYQYPARFGEKRPAFSRAMRLVDGTLFISGTASIVGCDSLHAGDVTAQTEETLRNLGALQTLGDGGGWQMKIYVRRAVDLDAVASVVRAAAPRARMVFLRADICRPELLMEIEACVSGAAAREG